MFSYQKLEVYKKAFLFNQSVYTLLKAIRKFLLMPEIN